MWAILPVKNNRTMYGSSNVWNKHRSSNLFLLTLLGHEAFLYSVYAFHYQVYLVCSKHCVRAAQSFTFDGSRCLVLALNKSELDKANKDRSHKMFDANFKVCSYNLTKNIFFYPRRLTNIRHICGKENRKMTP